LGAEVILTHEIHSRLHSDIVSHLNDSSIETVSVKNFGPKGRTLVHS